MNSALPKAVELAHLLAGSRLLPGAFAVDATCGNGRDTLFLASAVGAEGSVYACDLQDQAVRRTRDALQQAGLRDRVLLECRCHSTLLERLASRRGTASAILFNLGYLPGGDHRAITSPETVIPALDQTLALLAPGGILAAVLYSGHPGGDIEAQAVLAWARALPQTQWTAAHYAFVNQRNHPPSLLAIEPKAR
ncbi:MAG TPA: class I SAM-dependent methyltransferase [Verrucomicrobiales bacterium]|nr:class I SAM-dependent methyltransferase [Verrucomicrobiales bacterium]